MAFYWQEVARPATVNDMLTALETALTAGGWTDRTNHVWRSAASNMGHTMSVKFSISGSDLLVQIADSDDGAGTLTGRIGTQMMHGYSKRTSHDYDIWADEFGLYTGEVSSGTPLNVTYCAAWFHLLDGPTGGSAANPAWALGYPYTAAGATNQIKYWNHRIPMASYLGTKCMSPASGGTEGYGNLVHHPGDGPWRGDAGTKELWQTPAPLERVFDGLLGFVRNAANARSVNYAPADTFTLSGKSFVVVSAAYPNSYYALATT